MSTMYSYWDTPPQPGALLTRGQLARQHPGTDYKKYVNYVTRTRARRQAARAAPMKAALGPLAALLPPPGYAQAQATKLYPTMSEEEMTTRAKKYVGESLNPLIQQITQSNQAATQRGIDWIGAYAQGAAHDLAEITPQIGTIYDESLGQQKALDAAFQAGMGGAGKAAGGEAEAAMARFGQDGASGLAALGQGAGFEQLGLGGATTSQLITDRATNMAYAAQQPGIAAATGQQQLGDFTMQQAAGLRNRIGEINAQAPKLIQDLTEGYRTSNEAALANRAKYIADMQSNVLQAGLGWQGVLSDKAKTAQAMKAAQLAAATSIKTAAMGETGATKRTRLGIAADKWAVTYKAAHPTPTQGADPLSPSNIRNFQSGVVKDIKTQRNRVVTVPVIAVKQRKLFDHWALKNGNWVAIGKGGQQLKPSATGKTQKVNIPMPNNAVYGSILQTLLSQFGGTVDAKTHPGWYINQISAIAQRAGYAKASFDHVKEFLLGTPEAGTPSGTKTAGGTPTAPGGTPTAPTTPKGATAPTAGTRSTTGRPTTPRAPTGQEKVAGASKYAEKWQTWAKRAAKSYREQGMDKGAAFKKLKAALRDHVPIELTGSLAQDAVNGAWPGAVTDFVTGKTQWNPRGK